MRVLVIKTSSVGGIIHTLPALTDAKRAIPSITFDWLVEETFTEIPKWHPAVDNVIPVAIRRWRKHIFQTIGSNEWRQFKTQLNKNHYDLVIDCQGLLKSGWLGRFLKAPIAGFDKLSVREPIATWFYQHKYHVSKNLHAVERIRSLFSQALNYELPKERGDYGVNRQAFFGTATEAASVLLLHECAHADRLYPELYWRDLAQQLAKDGYRVRLPWRKPEDREQAERIAEGIDGVEVLPRLNLQGFMGGLAQSSAVVSVDNGLGHLSAALDIPCLSLYGPTNPDLIGTYGKYQIHLSAQQFHSPGDANPESLDALSPDLVYQTLQNHLLSKSETVVMPVVK